MDDKLKLKIKQLFPLLFIFLVLILAQVWQSGRAEEYINKGNLKLESGDYNGALRNFYYAVKLDGNKNVSYFAKIRRGEIFLKFAKYEEAERELTDASKEERNRHEAYELLGDAHYGKKEFDLALSSYNLAYQFSDDPEISAKLALKRAKVFIVKNEPALSREILLDSYTEIPESKKNKELVYYLGLLTFDKDAAANDYLLSLKSDDAFNSKIEQLIEFSGKYDAGESGEYNNVLFANLYNSIQEPYLAIARLKKTAYVNESYRDAWIVLGKSNFLVENYPESLEDFSRALKIDGHQAETFFWLGSVFKKIGNEKMADEYFKKYEIFK